MAISGLNNSTMKCFFYLFLLLMLFGASSLFAQTSSEVIKKRIKQEVLDEYAFYINSLANENSDVSFDRDQKLFISNHLYSNRMRIFNDFSSENPRVYNSFIKYSNDLREKTPHQYRIKVEATHFEYLSPPVKNINFIVYANRTIEQPEGYIPEGLRATYPIVFLLNGSIESTSAAGSPQRLRIVSIYENIDSDQDGIINGLDICGNTPSDSTVSIWTRGCLDTDIDGYYPYITERMFLHLRDPDDFDNCNPLPTHPKCDADGDNIPFEDDRCPNSPSTNVDSNGCVDADNDDYYPGYPNFDPLHDPDDENGCNPDSTKASCDNDNDSQPDGLDDCMGIAGSSPKGCPEYFKITHSQKLFSNSRITSLEYFVLEERDTFLMAGTSRGEIRIIEWKNSQIKLFDKDGRMTIPGSIRNLEYRPDRSELVIINQRTLGKKEQDVYYQLMIKDLEPNPVQLPKQLDTLRIEEADLHLPESAQANWKEIFVSNYNQMEALFAPFETPEQRFILQKRRYPEAKAVSVSISKDPSKSYNVFMNRIPTCIEFNHDAGLAFVGTNDGMLFVLELER